MHATFTLKGFFPNFKFMYAEKEKKIHSVFKMICLVNDYYSKDNYNFKL